MSRLHILLDYRWQDPGSRTERELRTSRYDAEEAENVVRRQHDPASSPTTLSAPSISIPSTSYGTQSATSESGRGQQSHYQQQPQHQHEIYSPVTPSTTREGQSGVGAGHRGYGHSLYQVRPPPVPASTPASHRWSSSSSLASSSFQGSSRQVPEVSMRTAQGVRDWEDSTHSPTQYGAPDGAYYPPQNEKPRHTLPHSSPPLSLPQAAHLYHVPPSIVQSLPDAHSRGNIGAHWPAHHGVPIYQQQSSSSSNGYQVHERVPAPTPWSQSLHQPSSNMIRRSHHQEESVYDGPELLYSEGHGHAATYK